MSVKTDKGHVMWEIGREDAYHNGVFNPGKTYPYGEFTTFAEAMRELFERVKSDYPDDRSEAVVSLFSDISVIVEDPDQAEDMDFYGPNDVIYFIMEQ